MVLPSWQSRVLTRVSVTVLVAACEHTDERLWICPRFSSCLVRTEEYQQEDVECVSQNCCVGIPA